MDPFTQRILERAENRSKALGLSKTSQFPLRELEQASHLQLEDSSAKKSLKKSEVGGGGASSSGVVSPSKSTYGKMTRQINVVDKENMDVGIEISITTGPNVEAQVEVEVQDVDADGNTTSSREVHKSSSGSNIRDCSKNRLQRLGALYSEPANLSSPIHRTEGKFHEGVAENADERRPKQKFGKLLALADSINSWEDDLSHPDYKHPKINENIKSPAKAQTSNIAKCQDLNAPQPPLFQKTIDETEGKEPKQLKWDKAVMDSLEAQGFQRRQSNQTKLSYQYGASLQMAEDLAASNKSTDEKNSGERSTGQVKSKPNEQIKGEKKSHAAVIGGASSPATSSVRSGLVSGRAAAFESKAAVASSSAPQKPQKDPAEMSLKERMALFEKNKGQALIPKAPFALSAPANKIRSDESQKVIKKPTPSNEKNQLKHFPAIETNVRDRAAAFAAGSSTISEANIKEDIRRQRQNDMNILANRFNRQQENLTSQSEDSSNSQATSSSAKKQSLIGQSQSIDKQQQEAKLPPPPPPMPSGTTRKQTHVEAKCTINNKRRSPGHCRKDSANVLSSVDDIKRVRVNFTEQKMGRLYPNLSDIETTESTATATASNCSDDERQSRRTDGSDGSGDADLNESFMDSDDSSAGICNVSLGREIMQVVRSNETQQQKRQQQHEYGYSKKEVRYADSQNDSSVNSEATSEGGDAPLDDYLDEALDEDQEDGESGYRHGQEKHNQSNGTTSSNSFSFKRQPKKHVQYQTISEESESGRNDYRSPVKSALKINQPSDDNVVTLVHTVSFYRRQQNTNSNNSTPVRKIHREQQCMTPKSASRSENFSDSDNESTSEQDNMHLVQEKVKKLLNEVVKQQQIIGQTSQALNLCAATIEFSGSKESVEGERHLLVATHRRQVALDEVQRLRVEGSLRPYGAPSEKGRLTVREITIPLKQEYIRKLATDTISGHHLVCLLKYNENVLSTQTVPTLPGLLAVKFPDVLQLNNVYADFKITLEIYGMTAQREILPHEVKYHINLNKKSGNKTPKSKKGNESRLIMPMVQSPAGPTAVRTPALVNYGFAIFSLREIQRNTWTLNQVSNVSPLEGTVNMKVNCELSVSVEHKGFLTMFEDISGFGAWHRRWCHLNGNVVSYWKYPDDEKKKTPMGSIDLYACCSTKVTTAPRDICARLNTFLLECQRPGKDNDFESLLIVPKGKVTIVRHLLSADTKEERDEWCAYFNKALTLLRAWGSQQ